MRNTHNWEDIEKVWVSSAGAEWSGHPLGVHRTHLMTECVTATTNHPPQLRAKQHHRWKYHTVKFLNNEVIGWCGVDYGRIGLNCMSENTGGGWAGHRHIVSPIVTHTPTTSSGRIVTKHLLKQVLGPTIKRRVTFLPNLKALTGHAR